MIRILFFLSALLPLQAFAEARSLASIEKTKELAEAVMSDVGNNAMLKGLALLKPYVMFSEAEFNAQMNNVSSQLPVMDQHYGKSLGYDFVSKELIGDTLVKYIFLQKFERHLMTWHFIFYKPKDKWLLNTFYFNDDSAALFLR